MERGGVPSRRRSKRFALLEEARGAKGPVEPIRPEVFPRDDIGDARALVGDLLRRILEKGRSLLALDDDNPVGVADDEVPGAHRDSAAGDRPVDAARYELRGTVRARADRVDGKAEL